MGTLVKTPWVGQYTMDRGFDIPWLRGRYITGRGFDIPREGGSIYHLKGLRYTMGRGINIQWVGGRYSMSRGSIYNG
jgi:hypothetical protein